MTTVGGRGGEDTTWREISLREDGDLWYHKKGSAHVRLEERDYFWLGCVTELPGKVMYWETL